MAVNIQPWGSVFSVAFTIALSLYVYVLILRNGRSRTGRKKKANQAPQAGGGWPLIGHLHLLAGPEPAHRVLGDLSDKYGPIFSVNIGVNRALVVSNWEAAKECLATNDRTFANRPKTMAMELLGYNYSFIGFSQYGNYWRQSRKIATLELLSNHRLEKFKPVREHEVKASIRELYEKFEINKNAKSGVSNNDNHKVLVDMKHWFEVITLDIILRLIVGKTHKSIEGGDWEQQIAEFFALSGKFVVSDALPYLRWLDIGGYEKLMKKTAKEFDATLQEWLDEHKMKRDSRQVEGDEDFMHVMLSLLDANAAELPDGDPDTVIKVICLTLILGATDTITVTMTWAMALLLNNPEVLKKAQDEIKLHVGTERQANESDMKNLTYLQVIIKEVMRLYPAGPLLVPHQSTEDCTVDGYHVPANTQLFVNAWKIQRDPRVWEEPTKFQPERFLTTHKDVDLRGRHLELMPFGSGRRICPGISFGLQVMQLVLASLLHGFDFETPNGAPVDMGEGMGLTLAKTTSVEVLLTPRLSASLYG